MEDASSVLIAFNSSSMSSICGADAGVTGGTCRCESEKYESAAALALGISSAEGYPRFGLVGES